MSDKSPLIFIIQTTAAVSHITPDPSPPAAVTGDASTERPGGFRWKKTKPPGLWNYPGPTPPPASALPAPPGTLHLWKPRHCFKSSDILLQKSPNGRDVVDPLPKTPPHLGSLFPNPHLPGAPALPPPLAKPHLPVSKTPRKSGDLPGLSQKPAF